MRLPRHQFTREFITQTPINEALDYYQSEIESTHYYADSLPTFHNPLWFGLSDDKLTAMPDQFTVKYEADEPIPFEA